MRGNNYTITITQTQLTSWHRVINLYNPERFWLANQRPRSIPTTPTLNDPIYITQSLIQYLHTCNKTHTMVAHCCSEFLPMFKWSNISIKVRKPLSHKLLIDVSARNLTICVNRHALWNCMLFMFSVNCIQIVSNFVNTIARSVSVQ